MAYEKQTWIAPEGTGLNRYAKGAETATHIELNLDPVNLTNTPTPITVARLNHMEDGIAGAIKRHGNTWEVKTWTGLTNFDGNDIWTDGENIYYSNGTQQLVLNKLTSTWTAKVWSGLTSFYGNNIWTDGDNIYYSNGLSQYELNKATYTWTTKTWSGLNPVGSNVWTDGENIYYSNTTQQFVLNKLTSTWTAKVWSGLTNFNSDNIWKDGDNIYYSNSITQYVLNKTTSTWTAKVWSGLTDFYGDCIWTDGENIYYSYGTEQYVLNKATSTWVAKTWTGLEFSGISIWTDGDNIYFSQGATQNVLTATIKANVIGNADTATKLATPRKIGSVDFDGSADITVENYSTTENRIGTWINGKPLYRKCVNFGALPNNANKNVAHGISNIASIVSIRGVANSTSYRLPLPYLGSSSIFVDMDNSTITIATGSDRSAYSAVLILEYTKTTD